MKRLAVTIFAVMLCLGCTINITEQAAQKSTVETKAKKKPKDQPAVKVQFHKSLCETVLEAARLRGSLKLGEVNMMNGYKQFAFRKESKKFWSAVIKDDLLPFKAMFCDAINQKDYRRAEFVKKTWIDCLKKISFAEPEIVSSRISRLENLKVSPAVPNTNTVSHLLEV